VDLKTVVVEQLDDTHDDDYQLRGSWRGYFWCRTNLRRDEVYLVGTPNRFASNVLPHLLQFTTWHTPTTWSCSKIWKAST